MIWYITLNPECTDADRQTLSRANKISDMDLIVDATNNVKVGTSAFERVQFKMTRLVQWTTSPASASVQSVCCGKQITT